MDQNENCERLFLLEILVENLRILATALSTFDQSANEDDDLVGRHFSLAAKLGSLPCFEIHHKTEEGELEEADEGNLIKYEWNEGKNCLFPMTAHDLAKIIREAPLVLILRLITSDGSDLTTGKIEINLGEDMVQMVRKAERWLSEEPVSEVLQDRFTITSPENAFVGSMKLVVRLTCLGAAVCTNFEIAPNRKFKFNKEDGILFGRKCQSCAIGKAVSCDDGEKDIMTERTNTTVEPSGLSYAESTSFSHFFQKQKPFPCMPRSKKRTMPKTKLKKFNYPKPPLPQVNLPHQRKKLFAAGSLNRRHNAKLRHEVCRDLGKPVPADHGWAWTTTTPAGLKLRKSWKPGFVPFEVLCKIDESREKRGLPPLNYNGPMEQFRREKNTPMLHVHRRGGQYALTLRTFGTNGAQAPLTLNIDRPDEYSDESDVEFEVQLPSMPLKQHVHSETQYREKDFTPLVVFEDIEKEEQEENGEKKKKVKIPVAKKSERKKKVDDKKEPRRLRKN